MEVFSSFFLFFEVVSLFNYQGSLGRFFAFSRASAKTILPKSFLLVNTFFTFFIKYFSRSSLTVFSLINRVNELYLTKIVSFCQHFFSLFFDVFLLPKVSLFFILYFVPFCSFFYYLYDSRTKENLLVFSLFYPFPLFCSSPTFILYQILK